MMSVSLVIPDYKSGKKGNKTEMNKNIYIFMEYKIKTEKRKLYQQLMKETAAALSDYQVESFQWFQAVDQKGLYVEMFHVPALSYYHTLKKERRSKDHPIFGKLEECVEGGLEKINCWAFYAKHEQLEE